MTDDAIDHLSAEHVASIGRMTPGLLHDLNNLLLVLSSLVDLVEIEAPAVVPLTKRMRDAIDRAAAMNKKMLAFARSGELQPPEAIELGAAVVALQDVLDSLVGRHIRIIYALPKSGCRVVIGSGSFDQLLINLAANARDAMPYGGRLHITVREATSSGQEVVMLEVADGGRGMAPEICARIFDPFFSTKEPNAGTGLGLQVVREIVTAARGWIEVDSQPGEGTTFRLMFPRATGPGAGR
jgi:two-component system, cell cycle sensor histidine kinase and response regulator CckA